MIKKRELICVISARGGSKGIKNKNILNFHGKPLIAWSILQATKSKCFNDVFISTGFFKNSKNFKKIWS